MNAILAVPLFLYLLVAANVAMLTGEEARSLINVIVLEFVLPSARTVIVTVSDALILAALLSLYLEIFKATRTAISSIIDHTLSLLVFVVFLVEFLVVARLGNATFLILTIASLADVVAGFTVTISTARRDIALGGS